MREPITSTMSERARRSWMKDSGMRPAMSCVGAAVAAIIAPRQARARTPDWGRGGKPLQRKSAEPALDRGGNLAHVGATRQPGLEPGHDLAHVLDAGGASFGHCLLDQCGHLGLRELLRQISQ